jgi:hypothetical protein
MEGADILQQRLQKTKILMFVVGPTFIIFIRFNDQSVTHLHTFYATSSPLILAALWFFLFILRQCHNIIHAFCEEICSFSVRLIDANTEISAHCN